MSKTIKLMEAFDQALTSGAVNYVDRDADTLVIISAMAAYVEKNNLNLTEGEIEEFAVAELNKRSAATADFLYNRQQIEK